MPVYYYNLKRKKKLNFVCHSELLITKQTLGAHDMEVIWNVCKSCTIIVFGCFSERHFDVLIFLNITGLWQSQKLPIVCIHWPVNNSNTQPVTRNDMLMSHTRLSVLGLHLFSPKAIAAAANVTILTAHLKIICAWLYLYMYSSELN